MAQRGRPSNFSKRVQDIIGVLDTAPMAVPVSFIARRLGLKKSPYILRILKDMQDSGIVEYERSTMTNNVPVFLYQLTDSFRSFYAGDTETF